MVVNVANLIPTPWHANKRPASAGRGRRLFPSALPAPYNRGMSLEHPKTILITGGSSGIGHALALAYAGHGVTLYVSDFERPVVERVQKDFFSDPSRASLDTTRRNLPRRSSSNAFCS